MKNFKTLAFALLITLSHVIVAQKSVKINTETSKINWVGKKLTGQHSGTINIKEGNLIFTGKKLSGGNFIVDMASINTTDLKAGKGKEDLDGHLKADDFFGVANHPTAKLIFKTIKVKSKNTYTILADLTIKGITNPVNFNMVVTKSTAIAKLVVDRTKYDIKYNSKSFFSSIGDKAIDDNFELNVILKY